MNLKLLCYLTIISFLFSCGNPAASGDDNSTNGSETGEQVNKDFVGKWVNMIGSVYDLSETTYEITHTSGRAEKGTLTYTNDTLTLIKVSIRESVDGDWLPSDFDSQFNRDLVSYNETLVNSGLTEITADEFWELNHQWSIARAADPYSMMTPYYGGYIDGMSLDEYKVAARSDYTAKLTRTLQWEISVDSLLITEDNYLSYYDKVQ